MTRMRRGEPERSGDDADGDSSTAGDRRCLRRGAGGPAGAPSPPPSPAGGPAPPRRNIEARTVKGDPPSGNGIYGRSSRNGHGNQPLVLAVLGDSSAVGLGVER